MVGNFLLGSESERSNQSNQAGEGEGERGRELLGVLPQVLHGLMSFSLVLLDIEGHEVNNPVMTLVMQLRCLCFDCDMAPSRRNSLFRMLNYLFRP